MTESVSLAVSVLALAVSATTAWLTLFRRGTVRMTQPTVIYLGPDRIRLGESAAPTKIYLRTLLFSTSKRGRVVESMHVSLARLETNQNFTLWVHGNSSNDKLVRGSGLFVGETGVATEHHFLAPEGGRYFKLSAAHYRLTVYAKLLGDAAALVLFTQALEITSDIATQLTTPGAGLYFDWGPESLRYLPHVEQGPPPQLPELLANAIASRQSIVDGHRSD
jgi:hypothetical protein